MTDGKLKIALLGDYQETVLAHRAVPQALGLAARALAIEVEAIWWHSSEVDDCDPEDDGWLLYLKPTVNGTEPADTLNYARQSPAFPHETTADQFFTERQFESHRSLGYHAMSTILDGVDTATIRECAEKADLQALFEELAKGRGDDDAGL